MRRFRPLRWFVALAAAATFLDSIARYPGIYGRLLRELARIADGLAGTFLWLALPPTILYLSAILIRDALRTRRCPACEGGGLQCRHVSPFGYRYFLCPTCGLRLKRQSLLTAPPRLLLAAAGSLVGLRAFRYRLDPWEPASSESEAARFRRHARADPLTPPAVALSAGPGPDLTDEALDLDPEESRRWSGTHEALLRRRRARQARPDARTRAGADPEAEARSPGGDERGKPPSAGPSRGDPGSARSG